MKQIRFDRPIRISFGKAGKTRLVHTVWEAMKCLSNDKWPNRTGPMCSMADRALRGAIHGHVSAEAARKAFADAAIEAYILVGQDRLHDDQATSSRASSSIVSGISPSPE
jgi:hypothetical protein